MTEKTVIGDNRHLPLDKLGDKCGKAIEVAFRPAVFNRYSAALSPVVCAQALHKCVDPLGVDRGRGWAHEPDRWQLRCLLRARRERPENR